MHYENNQFFNSRDAAKNLETGSLIKADSGLIYAVTICWSRPIAVGQDIEVDIRSLFSLKGPPEQDP